MGKPREDRPSVPGAAIPAGGSAAIRGPPVASLRVAAVAGAGAGGAPRAAAGTDVLAAPDGLRAGFDTAGPAGPGRIASGVGWVRIKEMR